MTPETVQEMYAAMKADPDGDGEPRPLCRAASPGRLPRLQGGPSPCPGDRPRAALGDLSPSSVGVWAQAVGCWLAEGGGESEEIVMSA